MTSIIFKIAGGVVIGALGFIVGRLSYKKKFIREMDEVYEETSQELTKMKRELDEFHKAFVASQGPEKASELEKFWKKVAEDIRKGPKKVAEESEPADQNTSVAKDTDEGISKVRSKDERTNYQAITCDYSTKDDNADWRHPTAGIVRREADVTNGIFEIEEWEYREQNEYPLEDVYYYENSTDVFTDNEELIEPSEIPNMLGYNQEELAVRFLHDDEPQCIYIRNPGYERVYCVWVCQGRSPDDHR